MRLFCTQEEEEYWMGEPIYEEDKSIGFHRLWFLNVLARKNDFDLSLQSPDGYFTKRTAWSELDHEKKLKAYIIHRTLLCNEIIFDFDAKNYETNVHYFKSMYGTLKDLGLVPYIYYSGNKGLHVHFYLSFKSLVKDLDMKLQKRIVKHFARAETFEKRFTSYIASSLSWLNDNYSVDVSLVHRNHLIRSEGSLNKLGFKTFLGHTPEDIPLIIPICNFENKYYPKFPFHDICDSLETIKYSELKNLSKMCTEFVIENKIGIEKIEVVTLKDFFPKEPSRPPAEKKCIKFIESKEYGDKQDGRKRALFILASHYKDDPEQVAKLKRWNETILNNYLSDYEIGCSSRSTTGKVSCKYTSEFLASIGCNYACEGCKK